MSALNLSALAAAAKVNDCELTLSQKGGTNFFTIGNEAMGYAEFSNYSEALEFLTTSPRHQDRNWQRWATVWRQLLNTHRTVIRVFQDSQNLSSTD